MKYSDRSPTHRREGSTLVASLASVALALSVAYAALSVSTSHQQQQQLDEQQMQAKFLAEAGVHRALQRVNSTMARDPFDPIGAVDQFIFQGGNPASPDLWTVSSDAALQKGNRTYGSFSATVQGVAVGNARQLTVRATGYVPDAVNPRAKKTLEVVVEVGTGPAQVFDYSYFINNWGWFYGNTIYSYGNARSNGQFDADGYSPSVFGTPRYADSSGTNLIGYKDDNKDGLLDGTDGGIYSGWDIVNVQNVKGMGGLAKNQHEFQGQVSMPNLSDLQIYENLAKAAGSTLGLGGATPTVVTDAVLGDGAGELENLVLIGTASQPIVLNGPVVVRGDVIIKGVVSGQGTIYAGRNIYIADNVTYLNGPATNLPASTSEADTEAWLATNGGADFLGLFAREHVVMGDFTNASWRSYVGGWLSHSMNQSKEDSGADLIPNTEAGMDGILGTEDDDVLEADGIWTVEYYTADDAAMGIIPAGFAVGDPIPGSGEDIDGDGVYDSTTTLSDFDLSHPLSDRAKWAGNLPATASQFSHISTILMKTIDAVVYTNHTAALVTLDFANHFNLRGSIISRNEALVYGTRSMNLYYDHRLSGGGMFQNMLPRVVVPMQTLSWRVRNDLDVEHEINQHQAMYP